METKYLVEIVDKNFQSYSSYLVEKYRSPSKGGNTKAWHRHSIIIDGEAYSFLALGSGKFAYKGERVSFKYEKVQKEGKSYNNVIMETFSSKDKNGKTHLRGNRGQKKWRTAAQRPPVSRREWNR